MNPEIDAALTIFFLGLGERGEAARNEWTHVRLVVARLSVKLVIHECERDAVGSVKVSQDLEEGASEPGMPGRECWKGRREVRPHEVARGRTERRVRHILRVL